MNAQYYFIERGSEKTRGPLSLEAIRALREKDALDHATLVCRVVAEEWQAFDAYPELGGAGVGSLEKGLPPATGRGAGWRVRAAVLATGGALLSVAGLMFARWWVGHPAVPPAVRRTVPLPLPAHSVVPTPVASPVPEPSQPPPSSSPPLSAEEASLERGTAIAHRILEQNPKLKVAVISGIRFPKPDGIELYGKGAFGASIAFILPEETWDALGAEEKLDLQAYVAGKVAWVREHAETYLIVPPTAPDYDEDLKRARGLVDGAWRIGSTQTYPDDPEGNLYFNRLLVKGAAY